MCSIIVSRILAHISQNGAISPRVIWNHSGHFRWTLGISKIVHLRVILEQMGSQFPNVKCTHFFDWYREVSKQNSDSIIALIIRKAPKNHSLLQSLFWSRGRPTLPQGYSSHCQIPSAFCWHSFRLFLGGNAIQFWHFNWLTSCKIVSKTICNLLCKLLAIVLTLYLAASFLRWGKHAHNLGLHNPQHLPKVRCHLSKTEI